MNRACQACASSRARIEPARQAQRLAQHVGRFLPAGDEIDARGEIKARAGAHRFARESFERRRQRAVARQLERQVEWQQPAQVVRFERDHVAVAAAAKFDRRRFAAALQVSRRCAPGLAVVVVEHGTAPVEQRFFRHRAGKLDTESDGAGLDQVVQRSGGHLARQAGEAGVGVLRQAPERSGDARKQQEGDEHERDSLGEQHRGVAQDARDRLGAAMQADQRRGEQGRGEQQPEAGRNALRVEVMREEQKEAEHDDDDGIAPRAHLHRFEGNEQIEERHAGVAAEQRAILPADAGDTGDDEQDEHAARRQGAAAAPQPGAPEQNAAGKQREPEWLMFGMRRRRRDSDREQPGDGALLDGRRVSLIRHTRPAPQGKRRNARYPDPDGLPGRAGASRNGSARLRR